MRHKKKPTAASPKTSFLRFKLEARTLWKKIYPGTAVRQSTATAAAKGSISAARFTWRGGYYAFRARARSATPEAAAGFKVKQNRRLC